MIDIWIPGKPMAKQSVRFARVGKFVRAYQPKKVENYQAFLKMAIISHMNKCGKEMFPEYVPLSVTVIAVWNYPKSWSKKRKLATRYKVSKPDTDNISKPAKDSMNGVVYKDDVMVAHESVTKIYGSEEGLRIQVEAL